MARSTVPSFCIVIPAFDAAPMLLNVLIELFEEFPDLNAKSVIVIDDGSSDSTSQVAKTGGADVVRHTKNLGKGAAILTGLREAKARGFTSMLIVDADGQHPAASARLVLETGDVHTLVLGIRDLVRDGAPKMNQFSNGISNYFISHFGKRKLGDTQCGLRRYPVDETLALGAHANGYAFEAEVLLLAMATQMPIIQVPIEVRYPPENERVTHFDSVRDPMRIIGVVVRTLWALRGNAASTSAQQKAELRAGVQKNGE
ncbi:MAG: glycosyltransferase family 2 protein [Polyangiaceae bacterium]